MIGKPVSADLFKKVLERQAVRDKFVKRVEEELRDIRPGECLLYESRLDAPLWANIGLSLLVDKIKGLKTIKEENCVYVYREK